MKKFLAILITVCFGLFFQQNVFADVADYSETIPANTQFARYSNLFSNCGSGCLNQYDYLIVEPQSIVNQYVTNLKYRGATNGQFWYLYLNLSSPKTIIELDLTQSPSGHDSISFDGGAYTFPVAVKFTLTNSPPGAATPCPEPEPCPDCETPPFVQIVVDAFWKYHVAFAAAVPAILVIFLVYRLIKGRLR